MELEEDSGLQDLFLVVVEEEEASGDSGDGALWVRVSRKCSLILFDWATFRLRA